MSLLFNIHFPRHCEFGARVVPSILHHAYIPSRNYVRTRQLPEGVPSSRSRLVAYGVLGTVLTISAIIAFNHQKSSASITHSTFYAVRKDPQAIAALGENIKYRDYWPWISGEINQIKGNIDFNYAVKGDLSEGNLHFHCIRQVKNSQDWSILDWSLRLPDGKVIPLTRDDLTD